jgi:hypothetical protein
MDATNVICRRCGQPLSGECAFDPRCPRKTDGSLSPGYLHPACANAERATIQAERATIADAAPDLLAACLAAADALERLEPLDDTFAARQAAADCRRAVAKASGQ